jgi:hypothetical protein
VRINCGDPHSLQVNVVIVSPLSHSHILVVLIRFVYHPELYISVLTMFFNNQLYKFRAKSSTTLFKRGCQCPQLCTCRLQSTYLCSTSVNSVAISSQPTFRYCERSVLSRICETCVTDSLFFMRVSPLDYPHSFLSLVQLWAQKYTSESCSQTFLKFCFS